MGSRSCPDGTDRDRSGDAEVRPVGTNRVRAMFGSAVLASRTADRTHRPAVLTRFVGTVLPGWLGWRGRSGGRLRCGSLLLRRLLLWPGRGRFVRTGSSRRDEWRFTGKTRSVGTERDRAPTADRPEDGAAPGRFDGAWTEPKSRHRMCRIGRAAPARSGERGFWRTAGERGEGASASFREAGVPP